MVDMRFGHGTWRSITEERAKRIREAKEAAAEARRQKIQKAQELEETIKMCLGVFALVVTILGLVVFLMVSVAKALV